MNVLPHASAKGRNQSGIIAGKLNGVIAATTPTGWRTSSTSTPAGDPLEVLALQQVRDRGRRLDRLDAAPDLAARVVERLAHVAVTSSASSSRWADSVSRRRMSARARAAAARPRASRLRRARGPDGGVDVGGAGERHQRGDLAGGRVASSRASVAGAARHSPPT